MNDCSPAAQVYDHLRTSIECLPHTGADVLPVGLFGGVVLATGLILAGLTRIFEAREENTAAARERHHGDNPLIRGKR